jgi:hypothetical protein
MVIVAMATTTSIRAVLRAEDLAGLHLTVTEDHLLVHGTVTRHLQHAFKDVQGLRLQHEDTVGDSKTADIVDEVRVEAAVRHGGLSFGRDLAAEAITVDRADRLVGRLQGETELVEAAGVAGVAEEVEETEMA